jgi:hypothetical protein
MTIVGTHRGAVSGKIHVHLLRESAAERAARAAASRQTDGGRADSEASTAVRSNASTDPQRSAG